MFQTLMILIISRSKSYNKLPVNGKNTEVFWCICCGYWLDIPWKLGVKDRILARKLQVEIVFWKASFELLFSNCHDFWFLILVYSLSLLVVTFVSTTLCSCCFILKKLVLSIELLLEFFNRTIVAFYELSIC